MTDRPFVLDDLHRVVTPTETSISPDGTVVVFVRSEIVAGKATTSLWAVSRDSQARRLTAGPADSAPRFSPDGTSIAFLRKVGNSAQLHLIPLAGGEGRNSHHIQHHSPSAPVQQPGARTEISSRSPLWSHVRTPPIRMLPSSPTDSGTRWTVPVGSAPSGATFTPSIWRRRQFDGSPTVIGMPTFRPGRPDGTALAFTANLEPDSDLNLTFSAYRILVDDLSVPPQRLGHATGVQGSTLWHPQGDSVVAIGTPEVRVGTADLIRLSVPGPTETPVDVTLTAHLDRNVMPGAPGYPGGTPALSNTGDEIVFCLRDRGWTHLYAADIETGTSRSLVANPNEVVSALSVARDAPRRLRHRHHAAVLRRGRTRRSRQRRGHHADEIHRRSTPRGDTVCRRRTRVHHLRRPHRAWLVAVRSPKPVALHPFCSTFTADRTTRGPALQIPITPPTRFSPPRVGAS